LEVKVGIGGDERFIDANDLCRGRSDTEVIQKNRRDPLVDEDSAVLRVIDELNHVAMTIGGFEQMSLRATAHLTNQTAGVSWHRGSMKIGYPY
jgi:hypothetical protein